MFAKVMKYIAFVLLVVGIPASMPALGQTNAGSQATIYIYRTDEMPFPMSFIFSRRMSVRFGQMEKGGEPKKLAHIASLGRNRYAILKLAPGRYFFGTRRMDGKLQLDLKAGETRYLRWDEGYDCPSKDYSDPMPQLECEGQRPSVIETPLDAGSREIVKTKPIANSDVKDRHLVIIPPK